MDTQIGMQMALLFQFFKADGSHTKLITTNKKMFPNNSRLSSYCAQVFPASLWNHTACLIFSVIDVLF